MVNINNEPICFVVMGYGRKFDYRHKRYINLDETYNKIIEPAVKRAGFKCVRCDSDRHSGIIDLKMYQYLKNSEFVIADISTLNPNALYELGIRHGIRPYSTILMIENKGLKDLPFDLNHISTFSYEHSGETIEEDEINKKTDELLQLIIEVREKQEIDSPYFTFMGNEPTVIKSQLSNSAQSFGFITCSPNEKYVVLALLGRWNDKNENDKLIIGNILGNDNYDPLELIAYAKEKTSCLQLDGIHWKFAHKPEITELINKYKTPSLFEVFKNKAIEVLTELDPKYELDKDKRFMASVIGKNCKYSKDLRFGISETLVWLSINKDIILGEQNNYLVDYVIYRVLNNPDWHLWASLNDLLPTLAEASPDSFLKALQEQISNHSGVIVELFKQEGDGIISGNLMTGILWSLETIAWFPNNFQMVIIVLAELSRLDVGGNYTNRPINSLKTLLLPWINNTTASTTEKMKAVKYLFDNYPDIAWKTIFSLLPSISSTSFGCYEPKYRTTLLENFNRDVAQADYINQISEYSNYAIELMKNDFNRIFPILDNLNAINPESYDNLFEYLDKYNLVNVADSDKFSLWEQLTDLIKKHRRFANAKWSYTEELIKKIEKFSEKIKPTDKKLLYRSLFTLPDYELSDDVYDEHKPTDWELVRKNANEKRETALNELIKESGLEVLPEFVVNDRMAISVATILGNKKLDEIDSFLIPKYLNSENEFMKLLCSSYIRGSSYLRTKNWYLHLNINTYKTSLIVQFLINLKFEIDTWELARELLGAEDTLYWENVTQNILACESDLTIAIQKFNQVGRFYEATECIHSSIFNKQPIATELIIDTLTNLLKSTPSEKMETYKLIEIIKYLENSLADKEILWKIEWGFYGLFIYDNKNVPSTLYKKMATTPDLYVVFLKYAFKEDNDKTKKDLSEEEQSLAQCAWNLLNNFRVLPGLDENGFVNSSLLKQWIDKVLELAQEVNRITSAKLFIGHLLYHAPADKDGFWIDRTVAYILNDFKNEDMLRGYRSEDINSRGAHVIDTTGAQENAIGDLWRKRAEELRAENYPFFANETESIAKFYYDSAKQSQNMANPPVRELF